MSFSLIRLTLYGLIVAVDMDLRSLVREHLGASQPIDDVLSLETFQKVRDRASRDGIYNSDELYDYLDFPDAFQALNSNKALLPPQIIKFLKSHSVELERLTPIRNRVMHARPLLFSDYPTVDSFVREISKKNATLFPRVVEFEEKVRDNPNYVFSLDLSQVGTDEARIPHNLPLPDYDETGFLGRDKESADLLAACKSNWPVITVVGEGGFGKTALALKTAYQILDDDTSDFEAIVWVTAKRTILTLDDIQTIDNAIQDSLGLIKCAAVQLGARVGEDVVIDEVADYLNTFKVLLILDNLETVLDPLLTKFIRKSTGKSKILITSRVGIGEMSYPFKLTGLDENDAVHLLRLTAKVRRVPDIYKAKTDVLKRYVTQMKLNAGFIKWFVASVQVGKRPDMALANPKIFLDFCLSNVYEHITENGRTICKAMIAVPGKHSLALISYLSDITGDDLQETLASLQSANIVTMISVLTDAGAETAFELNELPRLYILRNHPPSSYEDNGFKSKKRDVAQLYERLQSDRAGNRYNMRSIACRNPADAITGKLLSDALAASATNDVEKARRFVEQAKELDPSFYEVYRVEAALEVFSDRPALADAAYQSAIAFEPKSAPVRFWYGGFLLRVFQDTEAAETQLLIAEELDPKSPSILIELARVEMFIGNFDAADERLERVFSNIEASTKQERIAYDTWIQVTIRKGLSTLDSGHYSESLEACKLVPVRFSSVPAEFLDERIVSTSKRALAILAQLIDRLAFSSLRPDAEACYAEIDAIADYRSLLELPFSAPTPVAETPIDDSYLGKSYSGIVHNVNVPKRYGFIVFEDKRIFFHFSNFVNAIYFAKPGAEVHFTIERRNDRICAVDLTGTGNVPVKTEDEIAAGRPGVLTGRVKSIIYDKHFGFIATSDDKEYFFHAKNILNRVGIDRFSNGDLVTFTVGHNHKGVIADQVAISR